MTDKKTTSDSFIHKFGCLNFCLFYSFLNISFSIIFFTDLPFHLQMKYRKMSPIWEHQQTQKELQC